MRIYGFSISSEFMLEFYYIYLNENKETLDTFITQRDINNFYSRLFSRYESEYYLRFINCIMKENEWLEKEIKNFHLLLESGSNLIEDDNLIIMPKIIAELK